MNVRPLLPLALALAGLLVGGCATQAQHTVVHRVGGAVLGASRLVMVEPLRWDGARIEGMEYEAWLWSHRQGSREHEIFAQNRALLSDTYRARVVDECERRGLRVVATPTDAALVVRTTVAELSLGFWSNIGAEAEGRLRVDFVVEGASEPLDTIEVTDHLGRLPSSFERVRRLADAMGAEAARYLLTRIGRLGGLEVAVR